MFGVRSIYEYIYISLFYQCANKGFKFFNHSSPRKSVYLFHAYFFGFLYAITGLRTITTVI